MKRAFTIVELLVVVAVIASLMAIIMPSLAQARLNAKVLVTNAELHNIGIALEAYSMENSGKFPPTRADCNPDTVAHWWALPQELVKSNYMSGGKAGVVIYSKMEDKFNKGYAYKYMAPGLKLDYYGSPSKQYIQVPNGFPNNELGGYKLYSDQKKSPVSWVVFSLGPQFDENNQIKDGFPVSRKFWFDTNKKTGLITRCRLSNTTQIGTFESN